LPGTVTGAAAGRATDPIATTMGATTRGSSAPRTCASAPVDFVVPLRIRRAELVRYRPYYHENLFHAPHGHDHAVYYFPIPTAWGYAYEPRHYCAGDLFRGYVAYDGPRVSVRLGF
jgi:hypothetical protein